MKYRLFAGKRLLLETDDPAEAETARAEARERITRVVDVRIENDPEPAADPPPLRQILAGAAKDARERGDLFSARVIADSVDRIDAEQADIQPHLDSQAHTEAHSATESLPADRAVQDLTDAEIMRRVGQIMGRKRTAAQTAARRANIAKGAPQYAPKSEDEIECTCGRTGPATEHAWSCKRRRWAKTRQVRGQSTT